MHTVDGVLCGRSGPTGARLSLLSCNNLANMYLSLLLWPMFCPLVSELPIHLFTRTGEHGCGVVEETWCFSVPLAGHPCTMLQAATIHPCTLHVHV